MELQDVLFLSLHFTLFNSDLKYLMPGGNRLDIILSNTASRVVNTITVISLGLNPATNKVINA